MYPVILLVLLSPCVASFLAAFSARRCLGGTSVLAPSSCAACGAQLPAKDLVPVLSFFLLRGSCRFCRSAIPRHLPVIEIAAVLAVLPVVAMQDDVAVMSLSVLCVWLLCGLAFSDALYMRLPDEMTALLAVAALARAAMENELLAMASGALIGAGSFWALKIGYRGFRGIEGLGSGDIKLMAGLGALVGPWDLPLMLVLASGGAILFALAQGKAQAGTALPFGSFLCIATWIVICAPAVAVNM